MVGVASGDSQIAWTDAMMGMHSAFSEFAKICTPSELKSMMKCGMRSILSVVAPAGTVVPNNVSCARFIRNGPSYFSI